MKLYNHRPGDKAPMEQPDPYIICWDHSYYIYATHSDGVQLYRSGNFTDWEYLGFCYQSPGEKEYWAPSVMHFDGRFYMYYSSMRVGATDPHEQHIKVASSVSPEGPFTLENVLLPPFSIDPHAVVTPCGMYLFYCVNDTEAEYPGTIIVIDKLITPTKLDRSPKVAVRPTLPQEIYEKNRFHDGKDWYTVEGPYYFARGNKHYLLFSGSSYQQDTYFVGYCTAKGCPTDLRNLHWIKYPDNHTYHPLLSRHGDIEGTGHNSLIKIGDTIWIVYHARSSLDTINTGDRRAMYADILIIDNDRLSVQFR